MMNERELHVRLEKIEDNVNVCMSTNLALMAALSALPGAASLDANIASTLLRGLVSQQASLAALEQMARATLTTILRNAHGVAQQ